MITFVSNEDSALAVQFEKQNSKSVTFVLYAAVEETDCFNIIGTNGTNAQGLDDATILASGRVYTADGEDYKYMLTIEPHRMSGREFEGFIKLIKEVRQLGVEFLMGVEIDEYEYKTADE